MVAETWVFSSPEVESGVGWQSEKTPNTITHKQWGNDMSFPHRW